MKSRGIGDSIEKITTATGIKSIVNKTAKLLGRSCNCDKRKQWLNRQFPYKK